MIQEGHYAKKQILCQNQVIAWSHSSRFQTTRRLLENYADSNGKLLDYGCGDGTFLAMVNDLFSEAVGADLALRQVQDCQERFAEVSQLSFVHTSELELKPYQSSFDVAVCMEVLEHCLPEQVEHILSQLQQLVKPTGIIIVSVPIEIGSSLLIKQLTRNIAGLLRQGDYAASIERHTLKEFMQLIFAKGSTHIQRPIYGDSNPYHGHKGFNWRSLRLKLAERFEIEQTCFSPLGGLGGFVSSQVFLVCRNR